MKNDSQTIEEIIAGLPREERVITGRLRALILECLPMADEKNSYGVPFYRRNRMICFIWPPSIYWGKKKEGFTKKGVTLGFCQGNLMSNDEGLLLSEGRKQVYCMYFQSAGQIDDHQIRSFLYEAWMIDKGFSKKGRLSKKQQS